MARRGHLLIVLRLNRKLSVANIDEQNSRKRAMRLTMKKLAFISAYTICAKGRAYPQSVIGNLQPLVEMTAQRLAIAERVVLAKLNSGTPVEDVSREA